MIRNEAEKSWMHYLKPNGSRARTWSFAQ